MKMKEKKLYAKQHRHSIETAALLLSLFLGMAALVACGSGLGASSAASYDTHSETTAASADMAVIMETAASGEGAAVAAAGFAEDIPLEEIPLAGEETSAGASTPDATLEDGNTQASTRKLIRNLDLRFETNQFEDFTNQLQEQTKQLGGYVQSADISGVSESSTASRYAYLTLRIPQENLDHFLAYAESGANLLRKYESTQDITLTYHDIESRKKVLYAEQERLITLLAQAENMDAIIALEQRLSSIRYELERYESSLRSYDNAVQYSTVTVSINETTVPGTGTDASLLSRMQSGFTRNLYAVKNTLLGFAVGFITILPTLVVLGLLLMIIYLISRGFLRRWHRYKTTADEESGAGGRQHQKQAEPLPEDTSMS